MIALRLLLAAGLLGIAGMKFAAATDPSPFIAGRVGTGEWLGALWEVILAVWLASGIRARASAAALGLTGTVFGAWRVANWSAHGSSSACGCLGRYELSHRGAVYICGTMLVTAALLLAASAPSPAARDSHDSQ